MDFIYRNFEHVERVIADAEDGPYEVHYLQQPIFGFERDGVFGESVL